MGIVYKYAILSSMTRKERSKLNSFIASAPPGVVLTSQWLEQHNISAKLAWWYVQAGFLERVGIKAYKKAGDTVTWGGIINALQVQQKLPLHVGGKTALQLLGFAHFLPIWGIKRAMLFAPQGMKEPSWLKNSELCDVKFEIIKTSLFEEPSLGIIERPIEGLTLRLACPERAVMEVLHLCPRKESFEEASLLMENLAQMRPMMIQPLLEKCNSVKVKRLFLYFAELYEHPWLKDIDLQRIDLGSGKRVIGKGGVYSAKYMLSVPSIEDEEYGQ